MKIFYWAQLFFIPFHINLSKTLYPIETCEVLKNKTVYVDDDFPDNGNVLKLQQQKQRKV